MGSTVEIISSPRTSQAHVRESHKRQCKSLATNRLPYL